MGLNRAVLLAALVVACARVLSAAEYVVDQNHPRSSDTGQGTPDAPLKTISAGVAKLKPGDTLTVKAGTYAELVRVSSGGEEGKPVVVRAAPGERVVIAGPDDARVGITWSGVGYLRIEGFEVRGTPGNGRHTGISADDGRHIEISHCVVVGTRISLNNHADSVVKRCVQTGSSGNGITLTRARNCVVEECEVFGNFADGIVVAWQSDGCKVLRNYVHNNWNDNHPDGLQVYRGVTNFLVEGNLFFNNGQGFMLEETDGGVFRNNIICGTHHSGMILGHQNSHNWTVEQNTFAFTAYQALSYSGKKTVVRNNIILAGGDNKVVRKAGEEMCAAERNFFWAPSGTRPVCDVPPDAETRSKWGDPKFVSAPVLGRKAVFYIDIWQHPEVRDKNTVNRLYLGGRPLTDSFKIGDHIEVNFDGVVRTVSAATEEYVEFQPPLEKMHKYPWEVVVNWGEKREFVWDLRLAPDSPARRMGTGGQDAGSSVDMRAYMRGDFDGDGKRDLPQIADEGGRTGR